MRYRRGTITLEQERGLYKMRDGYWQDMKEKAEINPCPMVGILSDRAKTFHGLSKGSSFSGLHFLKITFKPGPKK